MELLLHQNVTIHRQHRHRGRYAYVIRHQRFRAPLSTEPLCVLLHVHDPRIVGLALKGLASILRIGQKDKDTVGADYNEYDRLIESVGGLNKIENLKQHTNKDVNKKAVCILQQLFIIERADEFEGIVRRGPVRVLSSSDAGRRISPSFVTIMFLFRI